LAIEASLVRDESVSDRWEVKCYNLYKLLRGLCSRIRKFKIFN
jgi:hypothetical protein